MTAREVIIEKAASQLGVKENPPGTNKTEYGALYGENGVKWCAIFVSWVYATAGYPLEPIDSAKGYASCQDGDVYWRDHQELTDTPQAGDIMLYAWDSDGRCDHTGVFYQWLEGNESFLAYEGNTSRDNNSNGGEVMLRTAINTR